MMQPLPCVARVSEMLAGHRAVCYAGKGPRHGEHVSTSCRTTHWKVQAHGALPPWTMSFKHQTCTSLRQLSAVDQLSMTYSRHAA